MLHFPGISEEDFDFETEWLVRAIDDSHRKILFAGQGRNGDLELELDFQDNPEQFDSLSVGELVQLPRELFVVPKTAPYQPSFSERKEFLWQKNKHPSPLPVVKVVERE